MKDNKLIAEFMGVDYVDIDTNLENNKELQYHTSWDWLMPVVESCFERLDDRDHSADEIKRQLLVCNMSGVYDAVVEFIKEHNRTTDYNKVTYYDGQG